MGAEEGRDQWPFLKLFDSFLVNLEFLRFNLLKSWFMVICEVAHWLFKSPAWYAF